MRDAVVEKAREFQKHIYFCFIDYAKAFDFVNLGSLVQPRCGEGGRDAANR